ncbi:MAG TPA: glutathione S-transferase family protein [Polyangia bacterium]|nr:glutathione S-transferase family protein [Polyangia bacterium]
MTEAELVLVGRSSSHFTRTARLFAIELGLPYTFRPVLDMAARDPAAYGDNPALKIPILIDGEGPLYGTENICRALARHAGAGARVVLRGDVPARVVANAEEMILHAMASDVALVMAGAGQPEPPKVRASLENALGFLEANVDRVLEALPADRRLSFCEAALYALVTHLPFRNVMQVSGYPRLQAFRDRFGARPGAAATAYRFDAPPPP